MKTFKWYAGDESRDKFKEVEIPFLPNRQKSWKQTLKNKYNKNFVEVNKDCHLNATWVATQTENAFAMGSKLIVVIKRHF